MLAKDLVDYITALNLEDWEVEMKVHGVVCDVVDAVRYEGKIRLYPSENEECRRGEQ